MHYSNVDTINRDISRTHYHCGPLIVHDSMIDPQKIYCGGDTHPLVDLCQPPPEGPCRQAAKGDIRAENSGTGAQRIWRGLRLLKVTNPSLN